MLQSRPTGAMLLESHLGSKTGAFVLVSFLSTNGQVISNFGINSESADSGRSCGLKILNTYYSSYK